uniref:ZP domain-containing protein n=1 Tax=Gopherus evgoodei TaxID=1825980 RepID=A0A8C4YE75_9SAUR
MTPPPVSSGTPLPYVSIWGWVTLLIPPGAARTECRGRYFWIWLDKAFVGQSRWHYGVYTESGQYIEVTRQLASQCGFMAGTDLRGNPQIRISFLACSVHNTVSDFSLQLRVEVTGAVGPSIPYDMTIRCPLGAPWSPREIVCEENYMEVSVRRAVPGIAREVLNEDWIAAWPVAQGALNQVWQVVFHFRNGSLLSMPATQAHSLGYGVNTTATRVLFRAPYGTAQSEITSVEGLEVAVARVTVFYKQAWMILMVDTAVACPVNSPVVNATSLSWVTPRILPSLVLWPEQYQDEVQMGLDGRVIDAGTVARNGYTFLTDSRLIRIVVPIGAPGGLLQSALVSNRYGTRYSIHLLLDRHWQGDESDRTRHCSYRPIHTPFSPQTPQIIDGRYTVAAQGYFKVRLGHFLPDVELVSVSVGGHPFSRLEAEDRGFEPHEVPNPNDTRAFGLRVPFADPLVQQQYLHGPLRRYTLRLNYTLQLLPTGEAFTQAGLITCDVPDVVPPSFQGSCEAGALALLMTHGTLDRFWVPYVGERPLSQLAAPHSYRVSDDGHHFHLAVPLLAAGLVYESISLQGLTARLDFSLRDKKTRSVLASFAVVCTFPTGQLLVCLPNGTLVAMVLSRDTKPAIDPRRTHLKDPDCGPVASDSSRALFSFSLASCGTTRRFEGGYLVYENEVTFVPEGVPATSPIITRDSRYRLTLRCRYPLTEMLWVSCPADLWVEVSDPQVPGHLLGSVQPMCRPSLVPRPFCGLGRWLPAQGAGNMCGRVCLPVLPFSWERANMLENRRVAIAAPAETSPQAQSQWVSDVRAELLSKLQWPHSYF